ncbi:cation-translocating P-type ATPase [Lacticaseibacillus rhamnosus]|uniref:cation-translocating P-type ATPase n=1 Tax=Lacticaseibacillus rhamnosus TaxID=47715 RepID=UPI0022AA5E81|nr:cation-transporting P-type ATPase [Lacticaseibacillus rhamnosus]MCZ2733765.1 cation-transporting P-type ATPase [Lacticaseibacillus rhamnosus]MCZ2736445.1 cation-transporting P-type ATPase [Lacticaseibacillus rhamnosus]MCZ2742779.1 cation-transporting P-type ATPase [Lacticaseibacillus rhamnosus]MCZ2745514.1 cation-transporting P-type ATPase [Lacticaseibacillus rhamnosus]MCZ2748202.1 cation-transporting P-type ATPase [Lacticaseibacillus rhamnosus]
MKNEKETRRKFATESIADLMTDLHTTSTGLSQQEASTRLAKYGENTITREKQASQLLIFLKNFTSVMAILLWVSGFVAILSGTLELGIAIWLVNIINGIFSYWQEHEAQKATNSLMKMLPTYTQVYRDGKLQQVNATQIVPGDVFNLQAGNAVPVDARLIKATSVQVDQSALTGESVPESKKVAFDAGQGEFAESNLVYAGTTVGAGTATAVAFATGMHTEFGQIAALTQQQKRSLSPLQLELNRLTKQISLIAISLGVLFFVAAIFFVHYPVAQSFIFALGMIVAFIPEGLLPTVTLSLAQGVQRMAKKHALLKDLNSVETLGETTVICSDKTGTLTQNQMTVDHVWTPAHAYTVTGQGYVNNGEIQLNGQPIHYGSDPDLDLLIRLVAFNNDTEVEPAKGKARPKILGTPTEASLVILAQKSGIDTNAYTQKFPRLKELPFDSDRKRMTTIHQHDPQTLSICTKGSLSDLLPHCDTIQENGKVRPLTQADKDAIDAANRKYATLGLRSIATAYREIPQAADKEKQLDGLTIETAETKLTFVGLAIMSDPPRPEIYAAIKKCHNASIKIIMVTGDSSLTAKSIAVKIGLTSDKARVVTGTELDAMSKADLKQALAGEIIFARVAPEQKYKIVSTLQEMGEIVASTGDGVNDAPALKKADIGVAMGVTGTDVAKDAADMILTDDNFASIVAAIEEGRTVYSNIQKFLIYILNSNLPEAVPSALFLFSRGAIPLPLTVMQILTVDLGTDMMPALGLGSEKAEPGIMDKPPRARNAHLMSRTVLWKAFAWYGLIASIISSGAYFFVNHLDGWPAHGLATSGSTYVMATTMTLAAIIFCQIAAAMNCRTENASVFKVGLFANRLVWFGIIFEIFLLALLSYTPFLQELFHTGPLALTDWIFLSIIPIPLFLIEEGRKWLNRRRLAHAKVKRVE